MEKDLLEKLIVDGLSTYKIAKKLGCSQTNVRFWLKKYDIKYVKLRHALLDMDREYVVNIINKCQTYNDIFKSFGMANSSTSYKSIKRALDYLEISTSHFLSKSDVIVKMYKEGRLLKKRNEDIFIENSTTSRYTTKKRILENKLIPYECIECGSDGNWRGKTIALILDHKNGVRNDNRLENLRFMCPNCNAGLDTHCLGNVGVERKRLKEESKKQIKKRKYYERPNQRKVKIRPSKEELRQLIAVNSWTYLGKVFGVSGVAIKKWAKLYELI